MAVRCEPTILDLDKQRLLAVWAIKTVYLLELAVLQRYPTMRLAAGYQPSTSEMAYYRGTEDTAQTEAVLRD
jgi:hypothetical protein